MDGIKIGYNELTEVITNSVLQCYEDEIMTAVLINSPDLRSDEWLLGKAVEGNAIRIAYEVARGLKSYLTSQLVLIDDDERGTGEEVTFIN